MKNITTVYPEEMENFFASFWRTDEFKDLQANHPYFKQWLVKMKEAPIFFFDLTDEKGKYHLTSHMRLICRRPYENNYMNDLYYLHELTHCIEFTPSQNPDYSAWKYKLNDNELYASIVSEVFIYFFKPSLIGKTFKPLWAEKFYNKNSQDLSKEKDIYGFFISSDEQNYYNSERFNLFSFNDMEAWPTIAQEIVHRRKELRDIINSENLDDSESTIIAYNIPRYQWIEKWEPHFKTIDKLLIDLKEGNISTSDYIQAMYDNCDEFYRPFFPK